MPSLRFTRSIPLPVSVRDLFAWHERPGAFRRMLPPWEAVTVRAAPQRIEEGQTADLLLPVGPLRIASRFVIREVKRPVGFVDQQIKGPFRFWEHWHSMMESTDPETSVLTDTLRVSLPPGDWIHPFAKGFLRKRLSRLFGYRHRVLANDLNRYALYRKRARQTVLITGASGLIGKALSALLSTQGHTVHCLRRSQAETPTDPFTWNPSSGWVQLPEGYAPDAVIHLSGAPVAKRWTPRWKKVLWESRIDSTECLLNYFREPKSRPPAVFIGASGINFYGSGLDMDPVDETHIRGTDFLSELCGAWETAAKGFTALGTRVCHLRIGMVLTPSGGALAKMLPAFRTGLGGRIGTGRQPLPWISLDDLLYLFLHCLESQECEGPYNAVAPELLDNRAFTFALGSVLRRPTLIPLPSRLVRGLFGDMGDTLLNQGVAALPARAEAAGFQFQFPELTPALHHLLGYE